MFRGSRITDVAHTLSQRGEMRSAVRIVRQRAPERFRWRAAVATVNGAARNLRGIERLRVEEPIREVVLDLSDDFLRREVVLDARKVGIDLDRGEVLSRFTLGQLLQMTVHEGAPLAHLARYTSLPSDPTAPIDTAACVVVARILAEHHRRRAHQLWLSVPDPDGPSPLMQHERFMLERAEREKLTSDRWAQVATLLCAPRA
jgi:hypothetical protein